MDWWWDNLNRKPWLFTIKCRGFLQLFQSILSSARGRQPFLQTHPSLSNGDWIMALSLDVKDNGSEAKIKHERSGSKLLSCRMSNFSGYWCLVEMLSYPIATSKLIESHSLQCPPRLALLLELPRGKGCHLPFFGPCGMSLSQKNEFFYPK